jgi:uncharacterized protein (TIGR02996 family)
MTSTHDALLAAILALPEDDVPRLVYADWLEEAGYAERAEFIRLQCELALGDVTPTDALRLKIREKVLLDRYGKTWLAPMRTKGEALQNSGTHGLFYRGFVETVWMPAAIFTWKAKKLFAKAPVRELRVTRLAGLELGELLLTPEVRHLRTLDLSTHRIGVAGIQRLNRVGYLFHLQRLRLRRCSLTSDDVEPFLEGPNSWRNLLELDLSNNPIDEPTIQKLRNRFGSSVNTGPILQGS